MMQDKDIKVYTVKLPDDWECQEFPPLTDEEIDSALRGRFQRLYKDNKKGFFAHVWDILCCREG